MGAKEDLIGTFSRYIAAYQDEVKLNEPEFDNRVYSPHELAEFLVGLLFSDGKPGGLVEHHRIDNKSLD